MQEMQEDINTEGTEGMESPSIPPELKVTIVSTIEYANRILGQIDIENAHGKYRTYFYRSTGTNVAGKNKWFPFSCLAGPGATERTYMHTGWIAKNMILSNEKFMHKIYSQIRNDYQHGDPVMRLNAFQDSKLTFSIPDVSEMLYAQYEANPLAPIAVMKSPVVSEDVEFINTWIVKGHRVLYKPKETIEKEELPEPKKLTPEEEATLRSMFIC